MQALVLVVLLLLVRDAICFYLPTLRNNLRTSDDFSRLYKRKRTPRSKNPETTMVKLRYDVDLVGKAGEIKTVSNAMWINMLHRRRLAFKVEPHHFKTWEFNAPEARMARKEGYRQLHANLSALPQLVIHSHAGMDNILLHRVSGKVILDEIRKTVNHTLTAKSIAEVHQVFIFEDAMSRKVINITEGVKLSQCGEYEVAIKIHRSLDLVRVNVSVLPHPWTTVLPVTGVRSEGED